MIKIDDDQRTIHLTKGDATHEDYNRLAFYYPIWDFDNDEETKYEFQLNDVINFIVFEKKGYTKRTILNIASSIENLGYVEPTTTPEIQLTYNDTDKLLVDNKKKTYFYEIVLNGDTTILGSDDEGDSKLIVYPSSERYRLGDDFS